jgi:predicted RNA binding protein YcfA (HicA-like mRNA interferase family)
MNKTVAFATLDSFLRRLGFTATTVAGSHLRYEHAPSGTVLVLREYHPTDPVTWADLTVVRRFLLERGLVEEEAFERLLQEPAA